MKSNPIPYRTIPTLEDIKSKYPLVKGLFFDMDGTLLNTEPLHTQALLMMGDKYNIIPPYSAHELHELLIGKADHLLFEIIKDWQGMPKNWGVDDFVQEKNQNVIELIKNTPASDYLKEEMIRLVEKAHRNGFFMALITSSEKVVTQELLKVSGLNQFFHLVLTRDDCPKHKPDPWPYLKAIEISQLEKDQIIIFEDSTVGIESATLSTSNVIKVEWY